MRFLTKSPANLLTSFRILTAFGICFCEPFTPKFCTLYIFGGASDILDGYVARKTGSCSVSGEKLDSVADVLFVGSCLWKLLPKMNLPFWMLFWIAGIFLIRAGSLVFGVLRYRRLIMLHTRLNKLAGLCLFLLPLTIPFVEIRYSAIPVCLIATTAAIQEGYRILTEKTSP